MADYQQYNLDAPQPNILSEDDVQRIVRSTLESYRGRIVSGAGTKSMTFDSAQGIWLGGDAFSSASFSVTMGGVLTATGATIAGAISASTIDIGGADATSFHVDVDGNMWLGAATFASAPAKISNAGVLTATGAIINGYTVTHKGTDGGDGSDGALTVSSGTTTIDLGNAAVVVKQYTSISVTGTGKVAFSNPHAGGTIIILKSQGAVTLTSSTVPCIDASGMGAAGGTGGVGASDGTDGTVSNDILGQDASNGVKGLQATTAVPTNGGVVYTVKPFYLLTLQRLYRKAVYLTAGSGGGGGGGNNAAGGDGGNGGRGGGALYIECAGALNFTGTISVAGANGSNGSAGSSGGAGGGAGGGGAAGMALILYNTLTAASGTITITGGNGGIGGAAADGGGSNAGGQGGGGAGMYAGAGGIGGQGGDNGAAGTAGAVGTHSSTTGNGRGTGGAGGAAPGSGNAGGGGGGGGGTAGEYLIALNTIFA